MSTTDDHDDGTGDAGGPAKKVFLVAAFRAPTDDGTPEPGPGSDSGSSSGADETTDGGTPRSSESGVTAAAAGPTSGTAEYVVAIIGTQGDHRRFEWVGDDQQDSVASPALVTPIKVRLGLPSPWHPSGDGMVTGLVQLAPEQLGAGSVDDDLDHLLRELGRTRRPGPAHPEVG